MGRDLSRALCGGPRGRIEQDNKQTGWRARGGIDGANQNGEKYEEADEAGERRGGGGAG